MQYLLTPDQASKLDQTLIQKYGIPGSLLMEQAACGILQAAKSFLSNTQQNSVLILCGSGNNGGDGFAVARLLITEGYSVAIGMLGMPKTQDAKLNQTIAAQFCPCTLLTEENIDSFFAQHQNATLFIDAIFGTGFHGALRGLPKKAIQLINAHGAGTKVLSVDIPSGISGETGHGDLAVSAHCTVTFQHAKPGHFLFPGRERTGKLLIHPIAPMLADIPTDLFFLDQFSLPHRKANVNKGNFGRLAIFAGSRGMAGASILCCKGALAAGAGLTTLYAPTYVVDIAQGNLPEVTAKACGTNADQWRLSVFPDLSAFSALAVGPGMGVSREMLSPLSQMARTHLPKVFDADALNILALAPMLFFGKNTILTPHPKEFSRLSKRSLEEVLRHPIETAKAFSKRYGVIVLLKGATTVVTNGEQTALITTGAPSMAKGGSGDVLTGIIAALLAQGIAPFEAAYGGAFLAGKAGEIAYHHMGDYSPTASNTVQALADAMQELPNKSDQNGSKERQKQ